MSALLGAEVKAPVRPEPDRNYAMPMPIVGDRPVRQVRHVCRACGCTDEDCSVCVALTGQACSWVTEYLCSACVDRAEKVLRAYARIGNRSISPGPIYRAAVANWRGNEPATLMIKLVASVLREARPNASW